MRLGEIFTKGRVLAGLMVASLGASLLGPAVAGPLRNVARLVIAPAGEAGMYATTAVRHQLAEASRETISQDEARRLRKENAFLRNTLAVTGDWLVALDRENKAIQYIRTHMYGQTRDMPSEVIRARIVGADSLPYSATRVVGAGSSHGASPGLFVTTRELWTDRRLALPKNLAAVTASAFVGRITESDAFTARLQLLTDRAFRLDVQIHRVVQNPESPRLVTIATGDGPDRIEQLTSVHPDIKASARGDGAQGMVIPHVRRRHEFRPGDLVLTRSTDGAVGAAVPVGLVDRVDDDADEPGLFVSLHVKPHANLPALREVYVIVPPRRAPGPKGGR